MNRALKQFLANQAVVTMLVSVTLGLAAGLVGALLLVVNNPVNPTVIETVTVPRAALSVTRIESSRLQATDTAERANVTIFVDKNSDKTGNSLFIGSEAIGSGLVLTSDGWVVTHDLALSGYKGKRLLALVGGSLYPIENAVTDEYSGAVFFKIPASNLSVAAFADRGASLSAGDQLFALDSTGGVRDLRVVGQSVAPVDSAADLIWSSDKLNRYLLCEVGTELLPGAMVMNERGEVVGIATTTSDYGVSLVPVAEFVDVVGDVFKGRGATRPYLGVNYMDLSEPVAMTDDSLPRRGALISGSLDGKMPAVVKGSPAAGANLREGDIIVSVNGELISERRTLSEIIATYFPGMSVTLGIQRRGADISVNLTLGERK